ncbi:ABC transporter permease [Roseateles sp. BYS180W]|uniref:ABC transporter permease n=1 Tax=Roseateles rivi TaxID=3299028 RepID=A0ABW7FXS2_9BURK
MTAWMSLLRLQLQLYFSNRKAVLLNLLLPLVVAAFFGSIFVPQSREAKAVVLTVGWVDEDASALSQRLAQQLTQGGSVQLLRLSKTQAQQQVRDGKLSLAVWLPQGFGQSMATAATREPLMLWHEPSATLSQALLQSLLTQSLSHTAAAASSGPVLPVQAQALSNYSGYNSYAHAFAGTGVQFVMMLGIELGVGLLVLRRSALWQRLRAAPLSKSVLVAAHFASIALIASALLTLVLALGMAVFGFSVQGSVLGLALVVLAFGCFTAGLGLLLAAVGGSPEVTRSLAIMVTLVLVMLGGGWVPTFVFPPWLQSLTTWVPVRWAVDGLEAMTWRALPIEVAATHASALMLTGAALVALAVWRLRWRE